jgi:methionine sulfoxide reductase heme-binding subunit
MPQLDPHLSWYAARASGLVAWALVSASVVWGTALSTRLVRRRGAGAWLLDVHRYLGLLSIVFVAVHVAALVADNWVHFGTADLLVPMASAWRPGAVAWGIVSMYLLLALELTSLTMRRLPRRAWHAVHLSSYGLFVAATVHGFTSGADARQVAVRGGALTGAVLVLLVTSVRVTRLVTTRSARRDRHGSQPLRPAIVSPDGARR